MSSLRIVPAVPLAKSADLQGERRFSGDGGNRTHAPFPTSADQESPANGHAEVVVDDGVVLVDGEDSYVFDVTRWYLHRSDTRVYVRGMVDGRRIFMHRLLMGLRAGDRRVVDHINGDTLDNRRQNLRVVTNAQNAQNQGARAGRYRGVSFDKSRGLWLASGTLDGRRTTIGRFATEDEAGRAAAGWRAEHMTHSREAA